MRLPRDINGRELSAALQKLGYVPVRQTGSHIRLRTEQNGEHFVTVPDHRPLRVGTLASILNSVAKHFGLTKDELFKRLFF
jgi:predicted RNA binding protein YcfA (HicA-like mRNA interferase family)